MAQGTDREQLCFATVVTTLNVLDIAVDDKPEQERFSLWFFALTMEQQTFLLQYLSEGLRLANQGKSAEQIGDELYARCLGVQV